jgi:hypothetical protein
MNNKLATNLMLKYPTKRPVLVYPIDDNQPFIRKNKFLVQGTMTMSQFLHILKTYISITENEAIFLFINNTLIRMSDLVSDVYERHNEDGFLKVKFSIENTFG